ncbi:shikimate kinase [soil metagenome]
MTKPKRIFIVGHMGAGKALLSEALAKKLGWQYIDANPSLERYIGRNLHEILGKQGEQAFHQCEAEIISHYIGKECVIVVMEEAVIVSEENRKLLSSEFVVYLKVSTATQVERMKGGRVPLLPIVDLKAFLDQQHFERDSLYEAISTLTVDSISLEEDVNKIISVLEINNDEPPLN